MPIVSVARRRNRRGRKPLFDGRCPRGGDGLRDEVGFRGGGGLRWALVWRGGGGFFAGRGAGVAVLGLDGPAAGAFAGL